jgi:hypothetical protein
LKHFLAALALCALVCSGSLPAQAAARFAVVAGNNQGAAGRAKLWFAEKDAERVGRALGELGDFPEGHVTVLKGGGVAALKAAVAGTEAQLKAARAAGERTLLVVYYSGHAGDRGLELGDERLAYDDLRALLAGSSAEAKVAIVDACEAGRLTQVKGASYAASVAFALPGEESVEGTAFITSSAAGEAAQESARIGGSFFTHHLEAALRGAGDADGDGKVTLVEAFRYASARTTSGTAGTEAGPQHPTYELRMSGRGEVVLADLRRGQASLRLPADPGATWLLRGPHDLLAEVQGSASELALALPAGRYQVERRGSDGRATAEVTLLEGSSRTLPRLEPGSYEKARAKGGPPPLVLYAGGGVTTLPLAGTGFAPLLRVGGRQELSDLAVRFQLDLARGNVAGPAATYSFTHVGGAAGLLAPFPVLGALLEAGAQVGYGWASQSLASGRTASAGAPNAALVAQLSYATGPLRLGLDGAAGAWAFKLNGAVTVRPMASLALVALYGW